MLCGSIKLPYCDKIRKTFGPAATGFEERPSLSCSVWVFHFDTDGKVNNCELVYSPSHMNMEQWVERGGVRRADYPLSASFGKEIFPRVHKAQKAQKEEDKRSEERGKKKGS